VVADTPMRMRLVNDAAPASVIQGSAKMAGESYTQARSYPSASASAMCLGVSTVGAKRLPILIPVLCRELGGVTPTEPR